MSSQEGAVYISQGRIEHFYAARYSIKRLLVVALVALSLIVTNPANRIRIPLISQWTDNKSLSWYSTLSQPRLTNYLVYSLENRASGISLSILSQSIPICRYDSAELGRICEWIEDNFCHETQIWDVSDPPYTAYRVLCALYIGTWLFAWTETFSLNEYTVKGLGCNSIIWRAMWSVLRSHNPVLDLIDLSQLVYPALISIYRLSSLPSFVDLSPWNFYAVVCVLVFGIGGFVNVLVTSVMKSPVDRGVSIVSAASLGCHHIIGRSKVSLMGFMVSPSSAFWSYLAILVVSSTVGSGVAFLAGGMMGRLLGQHLVDQLNILEQMWLSIRQSSNI